MNASLNINCNMTYVLLSASVQLCVFTLICKLMDTTKLQSLSCGSGRRAAFLSVRKLNPGLFNRAVISHVRELKYFHPNMTYRTGSVHQNEKRFPKGSTKKEENHHCLWIKDEQKIQGSVWRRIFKMMQRSMANNTIYKVRSALRCLVGPQRPTAGYVH